MAILLLVGPTRGQDLRRRKGVNLIPRRIVLLGTNPRSFAKGLASFTRAGFVLRSVEPFDVAPHTPFVALLGLLESDDPTPASVRAPRRKMVR